MKGVYSEPASKSDFKRGLYDQAKQPGKYKINQPDKQGKNQYRKNNYYRGPDKLLLGGPRYLFAFSHYFSEELLRFFQNLFNIH